MNTITLNGPSLSLTYELLPSDDAGSFTPMDGTCDFTYNVGRLLGSRNHLGALQSIEDMQARISELEKKLSTAQQTTGKLAVEHQLELGMLRAGYAREHDRFVKQQSDSNDAIGRLNKQVAELVQQKAVLDLRIQQLEGTKRIQNAENFDLNARVKSLIGENAAIRKSLAAGEELRQDALKQRDAWLMRFHWLREHCGFYFPNSNDAEKFVAEVDQYIEKDVKGDGQPKIVPMPEIHITPTRADAVAMAWALKPKLAVDLAAGESMSGLFTFRHVGGGKLNISKPTIEDVLAELAQQRKSIEAAERTNSNLIDRVTKLEQRLDSI